MNMQMNEEDKTKLKFKLKVGSFVVILLIVVSYINRPDLNLVESTFKEKIC